MKAMKKQSEKYKIPYLMPPLEKDPSDAVKKHGTDNVRILLNYLVKRKIRT